MVALADGVLPPSDFNSGLLFLIPKNGSLLPTDTRPISVTNADNRIIAQAVVNAITPYLYECLHPSQKGFIPRRVFEDHIRAINEAFYSVVEGDEDDGANLFILFMDTAKAFDSIDHSFIKTALKRTGLPDWLCILVAGLLPDVEVLQREVARPCETATSPHHTHSTLLLHTGFTPRSMPSFTAAIDTR